ncbi:MAG: hypothetical protein R6X34_19085 [Chloroflexota bacterium]
MSTWDEAVTAVYLHTLTAYAYTPLTSGQGTQFLGGDRISPALFAPWLCLLACTSELA